MDLEEVTGKFTISDIVARSLLGDNVVTGNDAKGLFVEWDSITIDLGTGKVEFRRYGVAIGSLQAPRIQNGDNLTFTGFEGKARIEIR